MFRFATSYRIGTHDAFLASAPRRRVSKRDSLSLVLSALKVLSSGCLYKTDCLQPVEKQSVERKIQDSVSSAKERRCTPPSVGPRLAPSAASGAQMQRRRRQRRTKP